MKKIIIASFLIILSGAGYTLKSNLQKQPLLEIEPQPTNPKLFRKIKLHLEEANEHIDFWSKQMAEHALFIYLGLTNSELKKQAHDLYLRLDSFSLKFKKIRILNLMNKILPILEEERNFQIILINKQKAGEWIGWLYPSLIKHMTMELDYFVNKLNGVQYSQEDEIDFWQKEANDRIEVITHLLDPSQKKLIAEANQIIDKYFNVPHHQKEEFKKSALEAIKQVNKFSKEHDINKVNIESLINKTLADHEMREGKKGEKILSKLS